MAARALQSASRSPRLSPVSSARDGETPRGESSTQARQPNQPDGAYARSWQSPDSSSAVIDRQSPDRAASERGARGTDQRRTRKLESQCTLRRGLRSPARNERGLSRVRPDKNVSAPTPSETAQASTRFASPLPGAGIVRRVRKRGDARPARHKPSPD